MDFDDALAEAKEVWGIPPGDDAQCIESNINFGGGGKVAIIDFGRVSSEYHVSITRKYTIPSNWTDSDVTSFEAVKLKEFKARIDPILDAEFKERWDQKIWKDDPTAHPKESK